MGHLFRVEVVAHIGQDKLDTLEKAGFKVYPFTMIKERQMKLVALVKENSKLNEELSTLRGQLADQQSSYHPTHDNRSHT